MFEFQHSSVAHKFGLKLIMDMKISNSVLINKISGRFAKDGGNILAKLIGKVIKL